MAIYRAYCGDKEITDFQIGGKSVSEIWGGDTLLWKKRKISKNHFHVGTYSRLLYSVPPQAIFVSQKSYSLYSRLTDILLSKDNIEFGSYIEEKYSADNKYTANSFFLCKAKSAEVKNNIKNFTFYKYVYDGPKSEEPLPMPPDVSPELYTKVPAKVIYSDNVFSVADYNESFYGEAINMFWEKPYIWDATGTPITTAVITPDNVNEKDVPIMRHFNTKDELMKWAIS